MANNNQHPTIHKVIEQAATKPYAQFHDGNGP